MRTAKIAIATVPLFSPLVLFSLLFYRFEVLETLGLAEWSVFCFAGSGFASAVSMVYIAKQVEDWRYRRGLVTATIAISSVLMVLSIFGFFYLIFVAEADLSSKVTGLFFGLFLVGIFGRYTNEQLVVRAGLEAETTEREPEERPIELSARAIDGRKFFFGWLGVAVLLNLYWALSGGTPSVEGQPPWTVGQRIGFTFGMSLFLWIMLIFSVDVAKGVGKTLRRLWNPASVWPQLPAEDSPAHFDEFRDASFGLVTWIREGAEENFKITMSGLMPGLLLSRETLGSAVSKRVTGADIEVGDAAFDDAALIRGDVLEVLSRLNAAQRARVFNFLVLRGRIQDGELEFFIPNTGAVLGRPEAEDVRRLAEGFQEKAQGSKEERLLAILREDPNPSVRLKVLAEMMRHSDELELDLNNVMSELIFGAHPGLGEVKERVQARRSDHPERERRLKQGRRLETLQSRIQSEKEQRLEKERAETLVKSDPSFWRKSQPQDRSSLDKLVAEAREIEGWMEADELEWASWEATQFAEAVASDVLRFGESSPAMLSAAYWLREHGESAESVAALSEVAGTSPSQEITAVAGQALAAIRARLRSRMGEVAGGLSFSESQDAGALSLAEQGGQLSVVEEEAKAQAAVER
jgi:hypothetical protein